jgi:hypothetical protein
MPNAVIDQLVREGLLQDQANAIVSQLLRESCVSDNANAVCNGFYREALISTDGLGPIPQKATSLAAYYQTGWFGNDSPDLMKMFRFGHIVTSNSGIKLTAQVVDDENYTFNNPLIVPLKIVAGNRFSVNRKGRRMNILIEFPPNDVDITVLELSVSYIPSSQR